jgi:hypothetical protein
MGLGANPINTSPSAIPTKEEHRALTAARRKGLPLVRIKIQMRYERVFDVWRVTFRENGTVLRECRFEHDHNLEETIRRGRGFSCLADQQAVEMGMRQGLGIVMLFLDDSQYGALTHPI